MHTYDAQLVLGAPQPPPDEVALVDGVSRTPVHLLCDDEGLAAQGAAAVDYHATEGRSWRLWLSADGARTARIPALDPTPATAAGEDPDAANASARGTAGELVLALYGRTAVDSLELDGDRRVFDQLIAWEPEE